MHPVQPESLTTVDNASRSRLSDRAAAKTIRAPTGNGKKRGGGHAARGSHAGWAVTTARAHKITNTARMMMAMTRNAMQQIEILSVARAARAPCGGRRQRPVSWRAHPCARGRRLSGPGRRTVGHLEYLVDLFDRGTHFRAGAVDTFVQVLEDSATRAVFAPPTPAAAVFAAMGVVYVMALSSPHLPPRDPASRAVTYARCSSSSLPMSAACDLSRDTDSPT